MMVYNMGNSFLVLFLKGQLVGCPSYFQPGTNLDDAQQLQDDENDGNHKKRMDNIACAWNS